MDWDEGRDGPKRTQYTETYWIENLLWALAPNFLGSFFWENTGNEQAASDLEAYQGSNPDLRRSAPVDSPVTRNDRIVEDINAKAADQWPDGGNEKVFI